MNTAGAETLKSVQSSFLSGDNSASHSISASYYSSLDRFVCALASASCDDVLLAFGPTGAEWRLHRPARETLLGNPDRYPVRQGRTPLVGENLLKETRALGPSGDLFSLRDVFISLLLLVL